MTSGVWWRIAWRNLWRNPRRTVITAGALAFGFLAAVVIVGMADGITQDMVEDGTEIVTGQIQIHAADYRPERSIYSTLGGRAGVDVAGSVERIENVAGVTAASPRVYGGGLISSGDETLAAGLMGIDPVTEPGVSRILGSVREGRPPRGGEREIVIGSEIQRKLGSEPGDEVVLVVPAADGSMGNDLYIVSGVFHTGIAALDGFQAIVPMDALQDLMALDRNRIHEIAVNVADPWAAPEVARELERVLSQTTEDLVAEPWTVFRAELREYAALAEAGNFIIVAIVFIMAIFGVANTMLMATYERRKEFAVVRALGTTGSAVGRTVIYEGLILGVLSLVLGAVITTPVMVWLHNSPIDLSSVFGDVTMAGSVLRPTLSVAYSVDGPVVSALALFVTSLLAAVFPAFRSVRVPPADALSGR